MTSSINDSFPHPELTLLPTDRKPNAQDIHTLKKQSIANAMAIPSQHRGRVLGHTALCLLPGDYNGSSSKASVTTVARWATWVRTAVRRSGTVEPRQGPDRIGNSPENATIATRKDNEYAYCIYFYLVVYYCLASILLRPAS